MSFASPVKQICSILIYGYVDQAVFSEEIKTKKLPNSIFGDMTWREFFIQIGTDLFRRKYDDATWIKALLSRSQNAEWCYSIITDCRFENEADSVVDSSGLLIRIDRNEDVVDQNDPTVSAVKKSESECGLDSYKKFHEIVMNHTNLHDLYTNLWQIYHQYSLDLEPGGNFLHRI